MAALRRDPAVGTGGRLQGRVESRRRATQPTTTNTSFYSRILRNDYHEFLQKLKNLILYLCHALMLVKLLYLLWRDVVNIVLFVLFHILEEKKLVVLLMTF